MPIRLLILDIDGVLTDSIKTYDLKFNVISKNFNDKDFTAIKRFKEKGIEVCFLSGDQRVNALMAHERHIDFYRVTNWDKGSYIRTFEKKYSVTKDEMGYVGDDFYDLSIMEKLNYENIYCPSDAIKCIKDTVKPGNILSKKGGEGVIAELFERFFNE